MKISLEMLLAAERRARFHMEHAVTKLEFDRRAHKLHLINVAIMEFQDLHQDVK